MKNAGYYERATGEQVREYFAEATVRLTTTGQVSVLTRHEYLGPGSDGEQVRDLDTGGVHAVEVRRKIVDARYLEASIPATHTIPFDVASGARLVAVERPPIGGRDGLLLCGAGLRKDGRRRVHVASG